MSKILNVEIKDSHVLVNGERLSDEEAQYYFRQGLKYEGIREKLGGVLQ